MSVSYSQLYGVAATPGNSRSFRRHYDGSRVDSKLMGPVAKFEASDQTILTATRRFKFKPTSPERTLKLKVVRERSRVAQDAS